jgi:integrase
MEMPVIDFERLATTWLTSNRYKVSAKTTGRRLTSVRAFARWARIDAPDLREFSPPVTPRGVPHPLPEGITGVRAMIEVARQDRHRAFIALCGLCGLRAAEALSITPQHFDLHEMTLKVRGKGDVTRMVPISPEAWDSLIAAYIQVYGTDFQVVRLKDRFARKLVTELGERAHLSRRVSSHDLRATFATAVYDKTKDMRLVQLLLGHASPNTTQLYVDIAENKLRNAVDL